MGQNSSHQCNCTPNNYNYTSFRCNIPRNHVDYKRCSGYSECNCDMVLETIIFGTIYVPCQQRRMLVNQPPPEADLALKCIRC